MLAVAPVVRTTLVTMEYSPVAAGSTPAGLSWCIMHDNTVLSWLVDETGGAPVAPVILGSFPVLAPDTTPILSPQWAARDGWEFMVPDMARGTPADLFTFIATNNGAHRPIYANFTDAGLIKDFQSWAKAHPKLALATKPQ